MICCGTDRTAADKLIIIHAEGLIPRRLRCNKGYQTRLQPPYENIQCETLSTVPDACVGGMLLFCFDAVVACDDFKEILYVLRRVIFRVFEIVVDRFDFIETRFDCRFDGLRVVDDEELIGTVFLSEVYAVG